MEIVNKYLSIVAEAARIAKENMNNETSIANVETKAKELSVSLEHDAYIKVPLVGDFSAGKSSLLNTFMGLPNFLPTDILPQTAVSYELYYSEKEYLEIWEDGEKKATYPISQLNSLDTKPTYLVKLYVNNETIKSLNERNIIVVDMPGIDSGLEAHSNAIMNYIAEGTHFVVLTDCEQGTLRTTTVEFLNEIKKYGVGASLLLTKTDKKPESEIAGIKDSVGDIAKRNFGNDIYVGVTSAANNNTKDLESVLDSLDAQQLIETKYKLQVELFVKSIAQELEVQINLILSSKEDYSKKIEELKGAKSKALASLKENNDKAQPVEGSADDILNDINEALNSSSTSLATALFSGQDIQQINATIVSVIRPVLLNSFKRELSEYQEVIGSAVQEFTLKVNDILNDKDNNMLANAEELVGNIIGKDILEGLLKKGLDKLAVKLVNYKGLGTLVSALSKVVGPLVTIVVNVIPDVLRLIFGKSREQKIAEIKAKLTNEVYGKITESLRPEIEKLILAQRMEAQQSMVAIISEEAQKYDAMIKEMIEKQNLSQAEYEEKVAALNKAIEELNTLIKWD